MLKPGDIAPSFGLPAVAGDRIITVDLAKVDAETIVLFFYPKDFSFICPTEVVGFHKAREAFEQENTRLLGMSVDSADSHLRWARELGGIGYPLIADEGGATAHAYGVFDEAHKVAMRATFILDRKRTILYTVASTVNVGRSVSETLRVVSALRTGRLCPADWQPGQPLGPPDLEY